MGSGRKPSLVRRVVAAECADIIECPGLASHHPFARGEIRAGGVLGLGLEHRLVETGRQGVDEIDIAGELAVLFLRDATGDEDAEMADLLMDVYTMVWP